MNLLSPLGRVLRKLRGNRDWSQEELAANAGVDRRYMSDLENGKRNPSLDVLWRIASALDIPASELLRLAEHEGGAEFTDVESLKQWLCSTDHEDTVVLESPSYLSAIVGITEQGALVYSYSKMVQHLIEEGGMDFCDAMEFIDYNTVRAIPYMGEKAPVILYDIPAEL